MWEEHCELRLGILIRDNTSYWDSGSVAVVPFGHEQLCACFHHEATTVIYVFYIISLNCMVFYELESCCQSVVIKLILKKL